MDLSVVVSLGVRSPAKENSGQPRREFGFNFPFSLGWHYGDCNFLRGAWKCPQPQCFAEAASRGCLASMRRRYSCIFFIIRG
jgi:hypothetical protein